jgi:hypothetical protein
MLVFESEACASAPAIPLVGGAFRVGGSVLQIPSCEPQEIVAGDTVLWTKSLADFLPSDGWALKYRLTNAPANAEITAANIVATANAAGYWDVVIAAASTSVAAGTWRLIGWVLLASGERHVVYDDVLSVLPDAAAATPANLLTPNERILAAIDARLLGRVTADQETVQVNGSALTRIPIQELSVLRGVYAAKVWREKHQDVSNPVHRMRFRSAR